MDNTKDIQGADSEQKRSSVVVEKSVKDSNPIDYFSKDESFVFVYKKTEKLATALYMVTNLFGDAEPMKWTLRSRTSHLLSFIIGFKDILASREEEFSYEVKAKVLEIVSLLEIASRSGLVSRMNFSILKTEFMNLVNFLSEFKKGTQHYADLQDNFFESSRTFIPRVRTESPASVVHIRQESVSETPKDPQKRTNRQNIIINLLKKKKEITIHDVAHIISDCSEKTIQRELISLIELGIVKKVGERRWSKYYLVSED